jgi:hypothetical protein
VFIAGTARERRLTDWRLEMVWTRFMDMSSGGSRKEGFSKLYIEAPEEEAKVIFYNRFGHNPERVTCTCCGEDYSIDGDNETLEEASQYDRRDGWDDDAKVVPLEQWLADGVDLSGFTYRDGSRDKIAVIYAADIKPEEREGSVPTEGYVWV